MRTSALVKTEIRPTGFPPVAKTLPRAVKRIVAELKPEKIILFGSRMRMGIPRLTAMWIYWWSLKLVKKILGILLGFLNI